MFLNLVIQIDNMQDVQKLTFVLVKSLYLYVKDGTRIDFNVIVLLDIFCKSYLILILDVHEFMLCFFIISINFQFANLRKICDPFITDMFCYPLCKKRICMEQETTL